MLSDWTKPYEPVPTAVPEPAILLSWEVAALIGVVASRRKRAT